MTAAKKLLLIDDDPGYSQMVSLFLSRWYGVCVAGSVEDGLAALRESKPDLVLLDLMMPVASGLDFLERLPVECPECADVPVVVLTAAHVESLGARLAPKLGALAAVIEKPFELASLGRRVDYALSLPCQANLQTQSSDSLASLPRWARL